MEKIFNKQIQNLTKFHFNNCKEYKKILKTINYNLKNENLEDQPFLPINLFKEKDLKSISNDKIVKILQSSGTTGSKSKIYLDHSNAINQKKVLHDLTKKILPEKRIPMIIIDQNPQLTERNKIEARLAGIYGFSIFGSNHAYLLNKSGKIDYQILNNFLKKYSNNKFLIFGFTNFIFNFLINEIDTKKIFYSFKNGILIHGGGWKKILDKKIDNKKFKDLLKGRLNLQKIFNYYGLVEQTGSIFFECEKCGSFYSTKYSKIFIRNKKLDIIKKGRGMIQLISSLPTSYPGHNILTEDEGEIVNNNCDCKKYGNRFKVHGRIEKSEIRGCSNV